MVIKKFVGKTEIEATEAAKKELGEGLVVMNVRDVKGKGLFAFLKKKHVEVTVALEEEGEQIKKVQKDIREAVQSVKNIASVADQTNAFIQNAASNQASAVGASGLSKGINSENIEKKLDSLQILLENQFSKEDSRTDSIKNIQSEQSKDETVNNAGKSDEDEKQKEDSEQEKFFKLVYNTMIDNEVDEKYINQFVNDTENNSKPNIPFDYILAGIYQKMVLKFGKSEGILPAQKGPKTVFFIGPTGVGKTTTIAKIASNYTLEQKKKVALITTDTYRIAAAEQLHTYANILEVPFRIIYTSDELAQAISDLKDYDYIFVDTAGHSHRNEDQMSKLKELFATVRDIAEYQAFLVLSATTKYKDLLKIAENYKEVTKYQLIFTKLDETSTLGNLINVKLYMDTPIAYITCGQNVPNDIEVFNPQKTVKQILGGKSEN